MIDIQNESLIQFRDVPAWCKEHLGDRVSPSTLHRWRLRGIRGVKLETILAGGKRFTSHESLLFFFAASTKAADGENPSAAPFAGNALKASQAEAYLAQEGF